MIKDNRDDRYTINKAALDNVHAAELRQLAHLAHRLAPDHRRPELFHERKSELEYRLKRLAKRFEGKY